MNLCSHKITLLSLITAHLPPPVSHCTAHLPPHTYHRPFTTIPLLPTTYQRPLTTKDCKGRIESGRINRHTPVMATKRLTSLCRPRPTYDVTAGHLFKCTVIRMDILSLSITRQFFWLITDRFHRWNRCLDGINDRLFGINQAG